jgi:hypothetical protein
MADQRARVHMLEVGKSFWTGATVVHEVAVTVDMATPEKATVQRRDTRHDPRVRGLEQPHD